MARIPLPDVTIAGDAVAHPFPIQISYQTLEFLQGALFLAAFGDLAAGEFVRQPGGVEKIEQLMTSKGLADGVSSQAWSVLGKYQRIFGDVVFQSVLVSLCSHWDWYVRRLTQFIRFARMHVASPQLSVAESKSLERADRIPLVEQIQIIRASSGIALLLNDDELSALEEMTLVRNLGLHNRWEVDSMYLAKTKTEGLTEGDLRVVPSHELQSWHRLLIHVLKQSSTEVARLYRDAPRYET